MKDMFFDSYNNMVKMEMKENAPWYFDNCVKAMIFPK